MQRVVHHLTAVEVEQLRRNGHILAGIQINDDCCSLQGPLISPRTYEKVCLPSLQRMVSAFKEAGAATVHMHCDGELLIRCSSSLSEVSEEVVGNGRCIAS